MIKNKEGGIEYLLPYSDVGVWPIDTMGLNISAIAGLTIMLIGCIYLLIKINLPKEKNV